MANKLKALLNLPRRSRCIDRIADNLDDILTARDQKITWQAIANSLDMERCTLINGVRTLLATQSIQCNKKIQSNASSPASKQQTLTIQAVSMTTTKETEHNKSKNTGIRTLGRTHIKQFNL